MSQVVNVESASASLIEPYRDGIQSRARAVLKLCWSPAASAETRIVHAARADGSIDSFALATKSGPARPLGGKPEGRLPGHTVSLSALPGAAHPTLVSCSTDGAVRLTSVSAGGATPSLCDCGGLDAAGPVECASVSAPQGGGVAVAVGGRENDVQVWDLSTSKQVWGAKNVRHDNLNLREPVWVSAVHFLNSRASEAAPAPLASDGAGGWRLIAATKHKQVRVYDTRVQRRPVAELVNASEFALTALALTSSVSKDGDDDARAAATWGHDAIVSDTAGGVSAIDLRRMRVGGRYQVGGARPRAQDPVRYLHSRCLSGTGRRSARARNARVAAVRGCRRTRPPCETPPPLPRRDAWGWGVRHVSADVRAPCAGAQTHIWAQGRRMPQKSVYLKQRLNCVLWDSEGAIAQKGRSGKAAAEEDEGADSWDDEDVDYYSDHDDDDDDEEDGVDLDDEDDDGDGGGDDDDDDDDDDDADDDGGDDEDGDDGGGGDDDEEEDDDGKGRGSRGGGSEIPSKRRRLRKP